MSENVMEFSESNFEAEVIGCKGVVLVDFWATWCAPCKALMPAVETIADEFKGRVRVGKINVDENQTIAAKFNVRSIPMLVVVKDGKTVDMVVGAVPVQHIRKMLEKHL